MRWWTKRVRVGVVGLYQAGKSVFMTSLINHLRQHDRARLPVGGGRIKLNWITDLAPRDGIPRFAYERHRNRLGGMQWPDKTLEVSEYRCLFTRSDRGHTTVDLSLTDIPGERLADMTMAGRAYDQWSDMILELLADTTEYRAHAEAYLALMSCPKTPAEEVVKSYRQLMGRLIFDYLPVVTPSSFLIDPSGRYVEPELVRSRDVEAMAATRVSGLDGPREFAPLSASWRTARPEVNSAFVRAYADYQRQIVRPLAEGLRDCDQLVVLIDLTMLLAGGVGMYNGNKQMLRQLLAYVDPGQGTGLALAHTLVHGLSAGRMRAADLVHTLTGGALRLNSVRRIAFVATKADKIHEQDRTKLLHLLEDMTRDLVSAARHRTNLKVGHFVCAAVNSTESLAEYPYLTARLPEKEEQPQKYAPSTIPEQWPESWQVGDFRFPNVVPWMPANRDAPPRHIEMDRLWNFLLSIE